MGAHRRGARVRDRLGAQHGPEGRRGRPVDSATTGVDPLVALPHSASFPSGHAATAFAAAVAVGALAPRLRPLLVAVAALVAISRVYLGVHFPSDVIWGAPPASRSASRRPGRCGGSRVAQRQSSAVMRVASTMWESVRERGCGAERPSAGPRSSRRARAAPGRSRRATRRPPGPRRARRSRPRRAARGAARCPPPAYSCDEPDEEPAVEFLLSVPTEDDAAPRPAPRLGRPARPDQPPALGQTIPVVARNRRRVVSEPLRPGLLEPQAVGPDDLEGGVEDVVTGLPRARGRQRALLGNLDQVEERQLEEDGRRTDQRVRLARGPSCRSTVRSSDASPRSRRIGSAVGCGSRHMSRGMVPPPV